LINGTAVTSTAAELNALDGITASVAELNIMDGVTSTAAELNILDGVTSTAAELNILDGVTSTAAELNILDGVTASAAELNIMDNCTATAAEINTAADQSANGALLKCKQVAISATPTGAEQDTTFNLPAKCIVYDVFINVTTAETTAASKLMDVGLLAGESGGDTNGFLAGISCASTGIKRGVATVTAGGTETYFASTTRGVLLATIEAGANVAGDVGTYYEFPHIGNGTAVSVVYDADGADWGEFRGTINIVYAELA
jgi:hypothetical protein